MIDWNKLSTLSSELGPDYHEVVELFVDDAEACLARLMSSAGDNSSMRDDIHFLRGCALNLGMRQLARLCAEAEAGLRGNSTPVDLGPIIDCYAESKRVMTAQSQQGVDVA